MPVEYKAKSTVGLLTSSTLVANLGLSMEPFHLLSLSRLDNRKGVFSVPSSSQYLSMISLTLQKVLRISLLMTSTLCCDIPHPADRQAAASSLSSDVDKNHKLVKHLEQFFQS